MEKIEQAFLAWLNSLGIEKMPITNIVSLKDGVLLQKLLKMIDPTFFSLEGFSLEADHWSLCASNLTKLATGITKYFQTFLNMKVPEDYADIQAIARNSDKSQILKIVFNF